jgi:predicted P-loop ATPase
MTDFILSANKHPKPILANAITALKQEPAWEGVLAYDEFGLKTMMQKPPPWLHNQGNHWMPQQWEDHHDILATEWLQREGLLVGHDCTAKAVEAVARQAMFHPVRDYLTSLEWDKTARVGAFAETYLGAAPTPYHREVSRCMLVSGVARIMRPGCQCDAMAILEAPQGAGKSQAISALFSPWFSDDLAEFGSKDSSMQVRSAWGIEVAELTSMARGEMERVKAFISRPVDRFRPSYGHRVIEVPRQCVFVGSTNADTYLKDETGNRRFLPIRCGKIDLDALRRDRDQLWAEAVEAFKGGQSWWINGGMAKEAQEEQAARYQADPWQKKIADYIELYPNVSVGQVLNHLGIEMARWTRADQMRVAGCLQNWMDTL